MRTDRTIPESSIIIEYLDRHYPGRTRFIPADAELALQTRLRDRFYDLYVHLPMQKIVGDRLRPEGNKDPHGVEEAKARIQSCYGMIDKEMAARTWAMGEAFSLADCAASPALFYANKVVPFGDSHKNVTAYFERLKARPSLRAGAQGSRALFRHVPAGERDMTASKSDIIRALFAAYLANDRKAVEDALTDDFRFTSPYDDEIDKPTYFERCWRNSDWIERHELERMFVEGD